MSVLWMRYYRHWFNHIFSFILYCFNFLSFSVYFIFIRNSSSNFPACDGRDWCTNLLRIGVCIFIIVGASSSYFYILSLFSMFVWQFRFPLSVYSWFFCVILSVQRSHLLYKTFHLCWKISSALRLTMTH